ncbi:MAG: thiolase domain-containing protein [Caldisericaceae bacterium]|nr:thiolase domain-containing protein [Caldisericaceae bacterium]
MKSVDLIGIGMTKFGKRPDKTGRDLLAEAMQEAIMSVDKGIDPKKDIKALFVGYFTPTLYEHQAHYGPLSTEWLGLTGIPAFRTESACASGSAALATGYFAVASGIYDLVMVAGVEKMTTLDTPGVTDALSVAADNVFELPTGITFPGLFALMAQEYFEKYGGNWEDLQAVTLKNHYNGSLNPKAQFQAKISDIAQKIAIKKNVTFKDEMDFLKSKYNPMVAYPLRLFDCSPISDGASVAFLASEEISSRFTDKPLRIKGIGISTDTIALSGRADLTTSEACVNASSAAYEMAGITPDDVDIAELHDCFTINEVILSESLGFFKKGEGLKAAMEGRTALSGDKPINTDGGLKSKGHPVGATGIAMVHEIWKQLRGEAGKRQVKGNPKIGLTCNVGGSTASSMVFIFERSEK